jgi:hypothetical protein
LTSFAARGYTVNKFKIKKVKEGSNMELYSVVDKDGNELEGLGRHAKHFYRREQDARGVATQFDSIIVMKDGEGVQLEGAPFKVKTWEVKARG